MSTVPSTILNYSTPPIFNWSPLKKLNVDFIFGPQGREVNGHAGLKFMAAVRSDDVRRHVNSSLAI